MVELPTPHISYEDYYKHMISASYAVFVTLLFLGVYLVTTLSELIGIAVSGLSILFLICGLVIGDKWLKKQILTDCKEKIDFIDFIFDNLVIEQLRMESREMDGDLYEKLCDIRNEFILKKEGIFTYHLTCYNKFWERYRYLMYKNRLNLDLEKDLEKFHDGRKDLLKIMFEQ